MDKRNRTLSEQYYACSPDTQSIIKTMVGTIPTSNPIVESNNLDAYNSSSPNTKTNMEIYGLIQPHLTYFTIKK